MRMGEWSPEIVRFMEDAARVSDYFPTLAREVADGLAPGSRVCDAGCGMGQLAVELARIGHAVDAVDKSLAAVAVARSLVARERLQELVSVRQADFRLWDEAACCDRMIFCLSASVSDAFAAACDAGAKSLVVVNKVHPRFEYKDEYLGGRPIVKDVRAEYLDLEEAGIVCGVREMELDFGQPFRTLADAKRYFSLFRTRKYPLGATAADVERELIQVPNAEFPWYLPVKRRLSVFEVDMDASLRNLQESVCGRVTRRQREQRRIA